MKKDIMKMYDTFDRLQAKQEKRIRQCESCKLYRQDKNDLAKLADLIAEGYECGGAYTKACNFVNNLDTDVREQIPSWILKAIGSDWA